MKLCIHRGSKEIGGTCIEIESQGKRIILDIGCPFDCSPDEAAVPEIPGIQANDESLLGVIISHPHLDHYGLFSAISSDIPVLIGDSAQKIINANHFFFPANHLSVPSCVSLENRKPLLLGPFTITPYLMDHSAYDSYAILIASDGKRLFYSGDFRGHGRKGKLLKMLVEDPPKNVDAMLMEGTTLSRHEGDFTYATEDKLEQRFVNIISDTKGMVLAWAASQNIDRLVTIYKACRKTDRLFIVDMYTASILRAIENPRLPQPGWPQFKVFLPRRQKQIIRERELFDFAKSFSSCRIYPEQLEKVSNRSVMLFKPSMVKDLENAECLKDVSLIFSLWFGYLKEERLNWFRDWLVNNNIPINHCHTSGHAPAIDLQRLANAIKPKKLVPVHTLVPDLYKDFFDNVKIIEDGQWWTV